MEFVHEFRYVIIDQLYDKFSITKPIKLDLSDRLRNQRFWSDQRLWTGVCVFAGNPKNVVVFYMLLFFEPSLEPLGKLGFSTILDDSSSS